MTEHTSHQHSSFMNGFTLGLLAGAGGYFLFATDHGRQVRRQIAQEWVEAKKNLVKEGVIESADLSLRDFIQQMFNKVTGERAQFLDKETLTLTNHEADLKKTSKAAAKKTSASSKKFKGV